MRRFANHTAGFIAAMLPAISALAAAVDPASADDIRDIRGPKGIFPLWLVLACVAGVLLLAFGAYLLWRRKQRLPPVRPLLPFEIALQGLEQIRTLMDPAKVREFSIAISDIVRKYIEDAFHITATHSTTEEFLRDLLKSSNISLAAHRNLLAEFLNQCDMAKFAGVSLSRQIIESLHQSARSFVIESSKPPPAADTPTAPGSTPPGSTPARTTQRKEAHDSLPST
jgi:hypothetical protein